MTAVIADEPLMRALFGDAPLPVDRIRINGPLTARGQPLELTPHPDKAISQRATLLASLADGTSRIRNLADCRDVRANLRVLTAWGTTVRAVGPGTVEITGRGQGGPRRSGLVLDAGNSATTSRLLLAILAGSEVDCTVTGNELLRSRPMAEVLQPLRELGADITESGEPGRLPVRVRGGRLRGGTVDVAVDSAQPVSALLFAGSRASGPVRITRRTPARDHTERLLRWTGLQVTESDTELVVVPGRPRSFDLAVPGDPSGGALSAALHLASPQARQELTLRRVGVNSRRTGFLRILRAMGVQVGETPVEDEGPEPVADVVVSLPAALTGTEVAGSRLVQSAIDELPLVAALATVATGRTVIRDASEMRSKDTDRIATTVRLLDDFGARATATPDGLVVDPHPPRAPRRVVLPPDHRVAFAAFVLALLSGGGTELHGVSAVATSHPGALTDLARYAPWDAL
ncbi:3-phosphoshikimate 1-carboxyvinyltransferase [Streptomyces sp. NPDC091265]|uniref:3-phosphoshikimate 1-carboxyvinyltransferase n=1 Tax=unclassified Streptomyces TaxID=2593676 RepID=UPI00344FB4AB